MVRIKYGCRISRIVRLDSAVAGVHILGMQEIAILFAVEKHEPKRR